MDKEIKKEIEIAVKFYLDKYYKKYFTFDIQKLILMFDLEDWCMVDDNSEYEKLFAFSYFIISTDEYFDKILFKNKKKDVAKYFTDKILSYAIIIDELHKNFPQQEVQFQRIFKN